MEFSFVRVGEITMKKKLMLLTIAFGVLTFGGVAWANGQYRTIEVFFERIHVALNGQESELSKDSIIYDGSVYVPLRSVGEMLDAEVSWDNENRTVHLDFLKDRKGDVYQASTRGIYQYIALEHNRLLGKMIQYFKTDDMDGMKGVIGEYEHLEEVAESLQDEKMSATLDKMQAAIEMVRSGWADKNVRDYSLAWTIFYTNADVLNKDLKDKTSEEAQLQFEVKQVGK
jgi:uncharacterized protein YukE